MASSFTTNKVLEKPGNGDYVDTWNVPVNGDMDIIDQAFGGVTALNATGGSATLTDTQYRSLVFSISGAMSANVTYTIPSGKGGQWIVFNNTTDSSGGPWDVIIASGGGGTSYTVTRGQRVHLYSDGTNINVVYAYPTFVPSTIPAGTVMLFAQTSAPSGWTKITTYNDRTLRVVSGAASAGGSVAFTSAFTSQAVNGTVGATALTEAQLPSHNHVTYSGTFGVGGGGATVITTVDPTTGTRVGATAYTGSGQTHTHTFTGTAINLAVQYVDVILAQKD